MGAYQCMEYVETHRTVLVVEDEALIRMCSVSTLEDAGYNVVEAGNSAEALAILARPNLISIMMTDVQMPGTVNGLGLIARVLNDRPDIRSIVASGTTTAQDASDAGAFGMIAKPFMAQTLVDAIHDTILRH
ncbi:MAG: response regulator [Mucilaginibacter sp.]|nr:response regulator [Mucilaginibacter sp.]